MLRIPSQKYPRWWGSLWLCLGAIWLLISPVVEAQTTPTNPNTRSNTAFELQQFRPGSDPKGLFQTHSAQTLGQWNFYIGVFFHYGWDPLFLIEEGREGQIDVVRHQLSADVAVGLGLFSWLDISATIPMTLFQDGELPTISRLGTAAGRSLTGFYMRDIQIRLRFRLLDEKQYGVSLAIMPSVGVPSGSSDHFNGEGSVSFGIAAMLSKDFSIVRFALNFGYRYLDETEFLGLFVGHELFYSTGLGIEVIPNKFALIAELSGVVGLVSTSIANSPMSLYAGARLYPTGSHQLALNIGVGIGLLSGYGSPKFRFMFGFVWAPQFGTPAKPAIADQDGDGVPDDQDRCPKIPGPASNQGCPVKDSDFDGVPDDQDRCPNQPGSKENQGCPDKDSDGDGIPDREDRCPHEPGPRISQGCPVANDTDGDGIPDDKDLCPTVPGLPSNRGCPKPTATDRDGDGIPDSRDKCPDTPGLEMYQGCPKKSGTSTSEPRPQPRQDEPVVRDPRTEPPSHSSNRPGDRDGDGVPDAKDRCPDLPGSRRRRGCPRRVYVVVNLRKKRLVLRKSIVFYRQTRITGPSRSVLKQVAQILRSRPTMKIRVVGFSYSRSRRGWVRALATRRARAVTRYLQSLKIPASQMSARGYLRYWRRSYTRTVLEIQIEHP